MKYTCPVCFYDKLEFPPSDYEICPCCGTEFENDDERASHAQLRAEWIRRSAPWFYRQPPTNWNPWMQLIRAGYGAAVPIFFSNFQFQENVVVENSGIRLPQLLSREVQLAA